MEEKNDNDNTDNRCFFKKIALQSANRSVNQLGAVIARDNFNSGRQRGFDLNKLLLNAVNHVQRIQPVAHHYDATDSFALAVPFRDSFTNVRAE